MFVFLHVFPPNKAYSFSNITGRQKRRIEIRSKIVGSDKVVVGYDAYGILKNQNSLINEG
jgi:hypothetical protein